MSQELLYEVNNGIALLTLNRPHVGNAFDAPFFKEVIGKFEDLAKDDQVKVILLAANGKVFSGGGDINKFKLMVEKKEPFDLDACYNPGRLVTAIRACPKPVVALVQGAAAGAGFGLAMACDFRIIGQSTKLVPAFNGIGLPGDNGLFYFLAQHIGPTRTLEYFALNRPIQSQEALNLGIVNEVVEDGALKDQGFDFARRLLNTPLKVFAIQKEWTNRLLYPDLAQALEQEAIGTHLSSKEPALFAAVEAFLNKEKPDFTKINDM